ncbi:MAG: hypothetical protein Q7R76_02970 [Candidatus Woesearchaeota archaeon]|nr:hypothetical protein [Candidatus Woesearchaeota archaeon]
MVIAYRLPGADQTPLYATPNGMTSGRPTFSHDDIGRRVALVLDPAADRDSQRFGAVDILARGYLAGVNGTAFTFSGSAPQPDGVRPVMRFDRMDVSYEHVRAYRMD